MSTAAAAAKWPIRSTIPASLDRLATTYPRPAASPTIDLSAPPVFPRLPATDAGTRSAAESATADAAGGRGPVDQEKGVHRFGVALAGELGQRRMSGTRARLFRGENGHLADGDSRRVPAISGASAPRPGHVISSG